MGKFYDSKDPKGLDDVNGDRQALDSFSGDNFHINNLHTGTGVQNNNDGGGQQNIVCWNNGGFGSNSARMLSSDDSSPRTHALARDWDTKERRELMTLPPLPNAGQPLSPKELVRKENVFKQLIDDPAHYEQVMACEGYDAQRVLDNWQLMIECTRDRGIRTRLMRSMLELSNNSGLFPQCLEIEEVKDLKKGSAYGGYADIWTGKIGGMKVAVKVVHGLRESLKHERAIKVRFEVYVQSLSGLIHNLTKAIMREAIIWRNLNHPNIVPSTGMYWFNKDQREICLVSPWVDNETLPEFLKTHPEVDPTTQRRLASDSSDSIIQHYLILSKGIAQGLAYLHDLQITHGDIKGANVLVTPQHTACITDFGLSRIIDSQKSRGLANTTHELGPARWRAPELLKYGRSAMSPASDVYGFGYVCYEIYAKRIPFIDFTEYGVYNSVVMEKRTPSPPPETPYGMRQLMEECWRAEPGGRPQAAKIVERIGGMEADRPGFYVPEGILVDI
ncbi:Rho guanine nucleotide exchange factor [Marasmius tenuissimus]|uniref:Rho guanine nucleotide exchange factor n=1 Tax=Marasmius tenuissimus TaxID=585030 RepID=A0ABR2ZAW9_9AGAR